MAIADKFTKANNGVDAQPATLTSTLNPGGTTATLSTSTGWPQDSTHGPVHFTCFKADTTAKNGMLAGSQAFFKATLTGTTLSNITRVGGSSVQAYANGDPAIVYFTPYWTNDLIDGLLVSLDQDGTLKAGAVDVAAVLANNVVETAKIKDAAVTAPKIDSATLSTSEKLVGLTDDGKNIYERVFNGNMTATAGTRLVTTITFAGVTGIINASGYITTSSGRILALGQAWHDASAGVEASGSAVFYESGTISIISRSDTARSNSPYKLILRYTNT